MTTSPVTVTVARDLDAAVAAVSSFVDELNATLGNLASNTDYNADAQVAGILQGDGTARNLISDLRLAVSGHVSELSATYAHASSVGISLTREGDFAFDAAKLRDALESDFEAVAGLLSRTGHALDFRMSFVASSNATADGAYDTFNLPFGVVTDREANIIIADSGNNRIQIFDANGSFISTFGSLGTGRGELSNPPGGDARQQ